jgi:hypothetical protein
LRRLRCQPQWLAAHPFFSNNPKSSEHGGKQSGKGSSSKQGGTTAQKKEAGRKGGKSSARKS